MRPHHIHYTAPSQFFLVVTEEGWLSQLKYSILKFQIDVVFVLASIIFHTCRIVVHGSCLNISFKTMTVIRLFLKFLSTDKGQPWRDFIFSQLLTYRREALDSCHESQKPESSPQRLEYGDEAHK